MLQEYLTIDEIATAFKVTRKTIERWIKKGLPAYKFAGTVRINPEDFKKWIEWIERSNSDNTMRKTTRCVAEFKEKIILQLFSIEKIDYFQYPFWDIYLPNKNYGINIRILPELKSFDNFWLEFVDTFKKFKEGKGLSESFKFILIYLNYFKVIKPFGNKNFDENFKVIILDSDELETFEIFNIINNF